MVDSPIFLKAHIMHRLAEIDWSTAVVILAYGGVCWLWGWHVSLKSSGRMYDEGYRDGHKDGRSKSG